MATKTIAWEDGTNCKITVTFSGLEGNSNMTIASDPNPLLSSRTTKLKLMIDGEIVGSLTVVQTSGKSYSVAYSIAYK